MVAATVTLSTVALATTEAAKAISFSAGPIGQTVTTNSDAVTIDFGVGADEDIDAAGIILDANTSLSESAPVAEIRGSGNNAGRPIGSINRFLVAEESGVASFTFNKKLNYFGLLWGSINPDNVIKFFDGNTEVGSFTGQSIIDSGVASNTTRFVNFAVDELGYNSYDFFNRVEISGGGQDPFQLDNVAYEVVPTPALLPGIIGMGIAALRKRKQSQEESAEA